MAKLRAVLGMFGLATVLLLPSAALGQLGECRSDYFVTGARVTETDGEATVLLDREGATDCEATVFWQTSGLRGVRDDATATAGQDFVADSGRIVLDVGQTRARVTIDILDDDVKEGTETFFVHFDTPGAETLLARVDIVDDVPGWIWFYDNDFTDFEDRENGNGEKIPFYINVYCSTEDGSTEDGFFKESAGQACPANKPIPVSFAITGTATLGLDYDFFYEQNDGELSEVFGTKVVLDMSVVHLMMYVYPLEDDEVEPDETVLLTLSDPPGEYRLGNKTLTTLTIRDATQRPPDDDLPAFEFARSQFGVWERAGTAAVQVERDGNDPAPGSVQVQLRIGTPGSPGFWEDDEVASFETGQDQATVVLQLPPDDGEPEENVVGVLSLAQPEGGVLGDRDTAWLVIVDDDGDVVQQEEVPLEMVEEALAADALQGELLPAGADGVEEELDTPSVALPVLLVALAVGAAVVSRRRP